jgi:hypothetical protein
LRRDALGTTLEGGESAAHHQRGRVEGKVRNMETTNEQLREQAIKRIKEKRDFQIHTAMYVMVNVALVGIWWVVGAGFFWPIIPILGWGVGVVINGYVAYRGNVYTEEQIQREMQRLPR